MFLKLKDISKNFGPGLLMAATGIGVSHIVQSVQAGAQFGNILIWAIIFIHVVKYPFFLTSSKYVSHTKKSLLDGYYEMSPKYLGIVMSLAFIMVFAMIALVFLVGSAVVVNILNIDMPIAFVAVIYMCCCALVLVFGRYDFLDGIIKPIILLMILTTVATLIIANSNFSGESTNFVAEKFSLFKKEHFLFFIALLGWMPCTLDVVVWNSLWTSRKHQDDVEPIEYKKVRMDLNLGYVVTAVLAIMFIVLGKIVFFEKVSDLPGNAVPFIATFLEIYTKNLGQASYLIVAVGVFFTMFSTVISVLDGFTRTFSRGLSILNNSAGTRDNKYNISETQIYNMAIIVIIFGAAMVLLFLMENMRHLVMVTTIGSFIASSIVAILNLKLSFNLSTLSQEFALNKIDKIYYFVSLVMLLTLSLIIFGIVFGGL
ncbi:MAG: divalent metal cation transporter [Rickettsiales bacterium]|nr:divalent metal cation transporter [Rickettsiales bacterium]